MAPGPAPGGWKALLRRPAVLLALTLLMLASLVSLVGRWTRPAEAVVRPLSTEPGTEMYAAFSPDGSQVAYSARPNTGEEGTFDLFVRPVAGGAPRRITEGGASDLSPVWSPDGATLAFARLQEGKARYMLVSPSGGAARLVAEFEGFSEAQLPPAASWTRDGAALAVVGREGSEPPSIRLAPISGGAAKPITRPPENSEGDTDPEISPDGSTLAFVRRSRQDAGDVYTCDLSGGRLTRLTLDDHLIRGLAWTANGREIVFSSNRGGGSRLWRIPAAGGSPREIVTAGRQAQYPAVSGNRLVYSESPSVAAIWRAELGKPGSERSLIRSSGRESGASYSPDGRRIAYLSDQSGWEEVWVAAADGSGAKQITKLKGPHPGRPHWSPDGKTLLLEVRSENRPDIHTMPAAGGPLQRVARGAGSPAWSPDGKWIYYGFRQVWRIPRNGGTPEQLTRRGGSSPASSVDGKWVYYHRARDIWRVPAAGGDEEEVYRPEHNLFWGTLLPARDGLYFMEWEMRARTVMVARYDPEKKREESVFTMKRADFDRGGSFDLSPDHRYLIYPRIDQTETNLMLLEGFR